MVRLKSGLEVACCALPSPKLVGLSVVDLRDFLFLTFYEFFSLLNDLQKFGTTFKQDCVC